MSVKTTITYSRRELLGATAGVALGGTLGAFAADIAPLTQPARIGMIADLHQDVMHDGARRLDDFLKAMDQAKPDAIVNLGDFAVPKKANQPVIDAFNNAHATTLHVRGNHDTDSGHTLAQLREVWGIPDRHYARDVAGLRVITLDGNAKGSPKYKGGYPSYVDPKQLEWLEAELKRLTRPALILSHQPLAGNYEVDNAADIRALFARHADKIALCVNGHSHIDSLVREGGVAYLHINSASYLWVGGNYRSESYSKEIHAKHKYIASTCPYRDSLHALLTFWPNGSVSVAGRASEWVGASPADRGIPDTADLKNGVEVTPQIRTRQIAAR